jgi:RNA recognition motif-containing protein
MTIFVGNLNYKTTEDQLLQLFTQYGTVNSAKIMISKFTNRSRGYGYVEMSEEEHGNIAIQQLDNTSFDSYTISVSVARPRIEEFSKRKFPRFTN